jgi:hypothetical protein
MRAKLKAERDLQKIMDLLNRAGVKEEVIESALDESPTIYDAISRQGEAVLLFLESPAKFTAKLCKRCKEPFSTNYRYVAYCGDPCRAKAISEQTGVKWDWHKSEEERWGFKEPPLIIPPLAYQNLQLYLGALQIQIEIQPQQLPDRQEEFHESLDTFPANLPSLPAPSDFFGSQQEMDDPFDF